MEELETLLTPIIGKVLNQRENRQCDAGPPGPSGQPGRDGRDGLQGPMGERGPKGDQGDAGLKGEVGPEGPQGVQGISGEIGRDGRDGAPGLPGRDGLAGVHGPIGEKGPKGDQGDVGLKGEEGPQGVKGIDGAMGVKGDTGARGLLGPKGEPGEFSSAVFSTFKTTKDGINSGFFDGVVNYDTVVIGEDLIDKSSGIFTCKTRGTYLFVVSGHTQNDAEIGVHLNDVREMVLRNTGSNSYGNLSFTWSLTLNPGDRVQLRVRSGKFYVQPTSSYPYRMYFSGFLLA